MNGGLDEGNESGKVNKEEIAKSVKKRLKNKLGKMMEDPNTSVEDMFNVLRNHIGTEDKEIIDEMIKKG